MAGADGWVLTLPLPGCVTLAKYFASPHFSFPICEGMMVAVPSPRGRRGGLDVCMRARCWAQYLAESKRAINISLHYGGNTVEGTREHKYFQKSLGVL